MTILITYPRESIAAPLRQALEGAATTIYCPLRRLQAVPISAADRRLIAESDYIIVTSNFALEVYLQQLRGVNAGMAAAGVADVAGDAIAASAAGAAEATPATPADASAGATLIVLSRKMALAAQRAGVERVLVSSEENQAGMRGIIAQIMGRAGAGDVADAANCADASGAAGRANRANSRTIVQLCGNISIPTRADHAVPAQKTAHIVPVPAAPAQQRMLAAIPRVQVYENIWNDALQQQAADAIAHGCELGGSPVRRILVTSPSAYRRLVAIEQAIPQCFADPAYYALGHSTAASIQSDGHHAIVASHEQDVLAHAVSSIINDEVDEPDETDETAETDD
jgi:uroporphyrinogen-III synthase